jgi:hypothetical protein
LKQEKKKRKDKISSQKWEGKSGNYDKALEMANWELEGKLPPFSSF